MWGSLNNEIYIGICIRKILAAVFFKECSVLNFWVLHFNLRGLYILKTIGICFTMHLFIQTNHRVVHLLGYLNPVAVYVNTWTFIEGFAKLYKQKVL